MITESLCGRAVCACFLIAGAIVFSVGMPVYGTPIGESALESPVSPGATIDNAASAPEQRVKELQASFFTENVGQLANQRIRFFQSSEVASIGFARNSVLINLVEQGTSRPKPLYRDTMNSDGGIQNNAEPRNVLVELTFLGSNDIAPSGRDELSHRSNYFLGNDPTEWRTGVKSYGEIIYENLYDGIDLVYRTSSVGVKYDIVAWSGADISDISIQYKGQNDIAIDEAGNLKIATALGPIVDSQPTAYQGDQQEVSCRFVLQSPDSYGFECPEWDHVQTLVIDPLLYSTYLGGYSEDIGYGITLDSQGNALVTGGTNSFNFPVYHQLPGSGEHPQGEDAFITKLNDKGTGLIFSTFLGGTGAESSLAITLDDSGDIYVAGWTDSTDFPLAYEIQSTIAGLQDCFFTKLNPNGDAILASTYLGGSGLDYVHSIAVHQEIFVYIVGQTQSDDFPTTSGGDNSLGDGNPGDYGDGFLSKLLVSSGHTIQLIFSTYIGSAKIADGPHNRYYYGEDETHVVKVTEDGRAYVCGHIGSPEGFPPTNLAADVIFGPNYDVEGFFAIINPNPYGEWDDNREYVTFLGGSQPDDAYGLSIRTGGDSGHLVYITGKTRSDDFPMPLGARSYDRTHSPGFNDAYVMLLDPVIYPEPLGEDAIQYSSYLGGTSEDIGSRGILDNYHHFWITGWTESSDFPTSPDAHDATNNGNADVFVTKMDLEIDGPASLLYSTYLGGSNFEYGRDIAVNPYRCPYVTGSTNSLDYPTTSGAFQVAYGGDPSDAFVTEIHTCFTPFTVSGHKVNDIDGDGVWDTGEPGIGGWEISLYRLGDPMSQVKWTDSSGDIGAYSFTIYQPGTYEITEAHPSGWTQTAPTPIPPGSYVFEAQSGQDDLTGMDFLNFQWFTVSGHKVNDVNGDSIWNPGEPGIGGWEIHLLHIGDIYPQITWTASSGDIGAYSFVATKPGTYEISEVLVPGWTQTYPIPIPPGTYTFEALSGMDQTDWDFLNFEWFTVSGHKVNDLDGDGIWDSGEPGIGDWQISLYRYGDMMQHVIWTDNSGDIGAYSFTATKPGTYEITENDPYGWTQTAPVPVPPGSYVFDAQSGQDQTGKDFLNFEWFTVSGDKVEDIDGDGIRDPGEPTVPDWPIDLYHDGIIQETTITGPDGTYSFTVAEGGEYEVKELHQPGWIQTGPIPIPPGSYTFLAQSGQDLTGLDFLNFRLGTICGSKFYDDNHNSIWDLGEPAIEGWKIQLWREGVSTPYREIFTDEDGNYCFNDLYPGYYEVTEVMPNPPDQVHIWAQTYPEGNDGKWSFTIMTSGALFTDADFGNVCEYIYGLTMGYWKSHTGYDQPGQYDETYGILASWPLQVDIPIPYPAGDDDYFVEDACEAEYILDGGGTVVDVCHGSENHVDCDDQPEGKCLSEFRAQLLALHMNILKFGGPVSPANPCNDYDIYGNPDPDDRMACQVYQFPGNPPYVPPDPRNGKKVHEIHDQMVSLLGKLTDYTEYKTTIDRINNNGNSGTRVLVSAVRPYPEY